MWSMMRWTPMPRVAQRVSARCVNGRPALGISALPGSVAKIVWWSVERARRRHVGVADRRAVVVEVGEQRLGQVEPGDPQPAGGPGTAPAAGAPRRRGACSVSPARRARRPSPRAARRPSVGPSSVRRSGRGEVQVDGGAVWPARGQRRGERRRRVDDQQVAGLKWSGRSRKSVWIEPARSARPAAAPRRAPPAARSPPAARELERERRAHAGVTRSAW